MTFDATKPGCWIKVWRHSVICHGARAIAIEKFDSGRMMNVRLHETTQVTPDVIGLVEEPLATFKLDYLQARKLADALLAPWTDEERREPS